MAHGAGGKATQTLIEGLFVPAYGGRQLEAMGDAGTAGGMVMTTDSFVVKPLRFPGGSIGELAVNGTVNDLAVAGARPLAITVAMILEEGLDADVLRAEVEAIANAARAAGVEVIAGDTKVVERGHADGMYIATTGLGEPDPRVRLAPQGLRPGDKVLLSGSIGEHGTAIMLARGEFELEAEVESDTRSLWPVADALMEAAGAGPALHARRHPRRRRLRAERAWRASSVAMVVREGQVPVNPVVAGAAEILGIDPMYVANEGKLVAFVAPESGGSGPGRDARRRRLRAAARSARCARSRPGWCWWRRASAAGGSWTSWSATRCRGSVERSDACRSSSRQGSTRRSRSPHT